jgi:hypothetical protein
VQVESLQGDYMQTIYKFPLKVDDLVTVSMPKGAKILSLQVQNDIPCLWALVDEDMEWRENRVFRIFGTGHVFAASPGTFLGTVQLMEGALVFHVFEA